MAGEKQLKKKEEKEVLRMGDPKEVLEAISQRALSRTAEYQVVRRLASSMDEGSQELKPGEIERVDAASKLAVELASEAERRA